MFAVAGRGRRGGGRLRTRGGGDGRGRRGRGRHGRHRHRGRVFRRRAGRVKREGAALRGLHHGGRERVAVAVRAGRAAARLTRRFQDRRPRRRELFLELKVFTLQAVDRLHQVRAVHLVVQRLRRQRARELADARLDALQDETRLLRARSQLAVATVVVDRRDRILDVFLIKDARLEMRLRRSPAALVDHLEKERQSLLLAPHAQQLLAAPVIRVLHLRRVGHVRARLAARVQKRHSGEGGDENQGRKTAAQGANEKEKHEPYDPRTGKWELNEKSTGPSLATRPQTQILNGPRPHLRPPPRPSRPSHRT